MVTRKEGSAAADAYRTKDWVLVRNTHKIQGNDSHQAQESHCEDERDGW